MQKLPAATGKMTPELPGSASACSDIASQLIDWPEGDGFEVILGGGRQHFLPTDISDPEEPQRGGRRTDGRHLVREWTAKSGSHRYVWNAEQFAATDFSADTRILGLFEQSHMQYEHDRTEDIGKETKHCRDDRGGNLRVLRRMKMALF